MLVLGTVFHSFSWVPGITETRDFSQAIDKFTGSMHYARLHYMLRLRGGAVSVIPKRQLTWIGTGILTCFPILPARITTGIRTD